MPLAAYDDEGRLKKNALQGTGLGAATDRAGMLQADKFSELHDEARRTNATEDEMKATLQGRMDQYAGSHSGRLQEIADLHAAGQARYDASGSATDEERFALYDQLNGKGMKMADGFMKEGRKEWEAAGGAAGEYNQHDLDNKRAFKRGLGEDEWRAATGGSKKEWKEYEKADLERNFLKDNPDLYTYTGDKKLHEYKGEVGDNKYSLNTDTRDDIRQRNKASLMKFDRNRWQNLYDWKAERAYNERRESIREEVNQTLIPQGVERQEREAMIADKLELYNLFLGE